MSCRTYGESSRVLRAFVVRTALTMLVTAVALSCAPSSFAAVISNGTIQLGVNDAAHLIVQSGETFIGLRFLSSTETNKESLANGCFCEGWGVSGSYPVTEGTTSFSGYAQVHQGAGSTPVGVVGLTVQSTSTTTDQFKSVVTTSNGKLEITHEFRPSATTANLYEILVTITNISTDVVTNVRYRRLTDWDIPPTIFHEWVRIHVGTHTNLIRATTDGFDSANPLSVSDPGAGHPPTTLVSGSPDYFGGPADQGSLFDFTLGALAPGQSRVFRLYYGATANETDALAAVSAVGGEIYSLGYPSTSSAADAAADTDGPHVFIFAARFNVNQPPFFNAIPNQTAGEDSGAQHVTIAGVIGPEAGQDPTLTATSDKPSIVPNPSITGSGMTRDLAYTPATNANTSVGGPVTITVVANDGQSENNTFARTFTITITEVNDPPVAYPDSKTTAEDTPLAFPASDLTANDSRGPANESGQTLTVTGVSSPGTAGGTVALSAGVVTYTPPANFFGLDTFTYTVCDNGATNGAPDPKCATASVSITVTPVDDPPVLTVPGPITVNEGTPISFPVTATDVDGPFPLSFSVSNLPSGATLTPQPNGTSAVFAWTPNSAQGGPNPYIVQISVSDGQLSDTKVVSITVNDTIADRDGDGVPDALDNCPDDPNANQADVCHNSPQPVAATQTVTRVDNQIPVTFTTTVSNDKTDISFLPPTLFTVNCKVINSTGSVVPISRIPEAGPFVLNLGEASRPGDLVKIAARATATFSTTFDLRTYYPDLPNGKFTTICTYVQFGQILNPTVDDPQLWTGEIQAPPQTVFVGTYTFGGFSFPLPDAKFSQTNTVPVKFALKDSTGAFVTNCTCTLTYQQLDSNGNPIGSPVPASSTTGGGNQFKYDSKNNQYIFTVASRSLPVGRVQLQADLHDGSSPRTVNVVVTP